MFFGVSLINLYGSDREQASVVVDYNSGAILSSYNELAKMHPASLTKIMTLYVIFDKLENNEAKLTDKIKISQKASSMPRTKLGLTAGSSITLKDAILSIAVKSSNDISYAVAEHYSPDKTAQGFVDLMNEKAKKLNLLNTNFENPTGLHHNNQYTTALDMARLAHATMINHNSYYGVFGVSNFKWDYNRYHSTNQLLKYNGIDGIKTGYTYASGFNLITSANNSNNIRIVAVTMGFNTSKERDDYMKLIVEDGFKLAEKSRFSMVKYFIKPKNAGISDDKNIQLASSYNTLDEMNDYAFDVNQNNKKVNQDNKNNKEVFLQKSISNLGKYNGNYAVNPIDEIEDLTTDNYEISPYYKAIKRSRSSGYAIQVGAYATKKAAINASYKMPKNTLSPKQAYIDRKNGFYVVKFRGLSKNKAYSTCATLKRYSKDCIVLRA
jgi:D-alanyl-D-alanine carboxypeptidase